MFIIFLSILIVRKKNRFLFNKMSSPALDLNGLKKLYLNGAKYVKENFKNYYYSVNDKLYDYQTSLVQNAKTTSQLTASMLIPNPYFQNMFNYPVPICQGCEIQYTGVQFGVGSSGWYFVYGVSNKYVYNFTLFRVEIAPPDVVNIERSEAVRWMVLGGYGEVGGDFYSIPFQGLYLSYSQPSSLTFVLEGSGNENGNNLSVKFFSLQPMQFGFDISFTDTKKVNRQISSLMIANAPPSRNFPGACWCGFKLGTLYYSYPDMKIQINVLNDKGNYVGNGWIDHQWVKGGFVDNLYYGAFQNVYNILKPKYSTGWLWISVVDNESDLQYMFIYFLTKPYNDEITNKPILSTNKDKKSFKPKVINVYKQGITYINPKDDVMNSDLCKLTILETFSILGVNLPKSYAIVLPGGKNVIAKMACNTPNVYDSPNPSIENPGFLYDMQNNVIGSCLLEANLYLSYDQLSQRLLTYAGGNQKDYTIVKEGYVPPQKLSQKVFSFFMFSVPFFVVLFCLVFIFCGYEYKKEKVLVSIAIILLMIGLLSL